MRGVAILLFFYLLGALIASFTGNFIPGSVIGMILLFATLSAKLFKPGMVRPTSRFLLNNMLLFFIPVSVGLITSHALVSKYLTAIIVSTLLSTVLVIVAVGWLTQFMLERKTGKLENKTKQPSNLQENQSVNNKKGGGK